MNMAYAQLLKHINILACSLVLFLNFCQFAQAQRVYNNEQYDYSFEIPRGWEAIPDSILAYSRTKYNTGFSRVTEEESLGMISTPYVLAKFFEKPNINILSLDRIAHQLTSAMQREFQKISENTYGLITEATKDQVYIDEENKSIFLIYTIASYPKDLRVVTGHFVTRKGMVLLYCYAFQDEYAKFKKTFDLLFESVNVDVQFTIDKEASAEEVRKQDEDGAEMMRIQREREDAEFESFLAKMEAVERKQTRIKLFLITAAFILGIIILLRYLKKKKARRHKQRQAYNELAFSSNNATQKNFDRDIPTSEVLGPMKGVAKEQRSYSSLGQLIEDLNIKPPKKGGSGKIIRKLGAFLVVIIVLFAIVEPFVSSARYYRQEEAIVRSIVTILILSFLIWGAYRIFLHGRRIEQTVKISDNLKDSRKPILYLRSFKDDDLGPTIRRYLKAMVVPFYFNRVLYPHEEALMKALNPLGPLIAIGRPGEELPHIGAMRFYSDPTGEKWQQDVAKLLGVSRYVFLRAGVTRGLEWETKKAFNSVRPEQIVLYVDLTKRKYRKYLKNFKEWTQIDLPNPQDFKFKSPFFIYFDPQSETSVSYIKSPFIRQRTYQANTSPFLYGLKSLFEKNKTPWTPPRKNRQIILIIVLLIISVLLFCFSLLMLYG